jgi:hypothetical protein
VVTLWPEEFMEQLVSSSYTVETDITSHNQVVSSIKISGTALFAPTPARKLKHFTFFPPDTFVYLSLSENFTK